ncbi:mycofactocin system transcriptional regulator [Tsukamurella tyrosinosolvens]|uniref:mycofactocin system transcriptional regulator n=1 Tax=Tsukamurella tyrosinosolvens TaxID=57704 RepID=UPI0007986E7D|nr:mycofactocin system transcriptional regulator [Tsukamurella tyrosinosolvens]KXP02544.1 mycofactocin system transcriptional regulator [Tsukamurella tyrosinosolvens]KZL96682.1 mycofactocin system transcriptional regulator [Tsukamurella tyrosinosolvens]MCA4996588.1 mycofactocin system transcriptional regulator [Tsukamurella tyrosinosolvens]
MAPRGRSGPLGGRPSATTRGHLSGIAIDLFIENGFDETSVDDIAAAAGIARRTLFRYYPSKNSLAWGEFDDHLDGLRGLLDEADGTGTLGTELRDAIVAFNQVPESEREHHRRRMHLLLTVPALQAHSMIMYADWRQVIAEHVARRLGLSPEDHTPQTLAWMALGVALAAYDQWLRRPEADLEELLRSGCELLIAAADAPAERVEPGP